MNVCDSAFAQFVRGVLLCLLKIRRAGQSRSYYVGHVSYGFHDVRMFLRFFFYSVDYILVGIILRLLLAPAKEKTGVINEAAAIRTANVFRENLFICAPPMKRRSLRLRSYDEDDVRFLPFIGG